jgi:hypothetical protein
VRNDAFAAIAPCLACGGQTRDALSAAAGAWEGAGRVEALSAVAEELALRRDRSANDAANRVLQQAEAIADPYRRATVLARAAAALTASRDRHAAEATKRAFDATVALEDVASQLRVLVEHLAHLLSESERSVGMLLVTRVANDTADDPDVQRLVSRAWSALAQHDRAAEVWSRQVRVAAERGIGEVYACLAVGAEIFSAMHDVVAVRQLCEDCESVERWWSPDGSELAKLLERAVVR